MDLEILHVLCYLINKCVALLAQNAWICAMQKQATFWYENQTTTHAIIAK